MREVYQYARTAFINTAIIALNLIVFLYLELLGSTEDGIFMIAHGAVFSPLLTEYHEYSRLLTSMFMHFGAAHLMNNMLILLLLGERLERALGHVRYLFFYLLSGIGAGLFSAEVHQYLGEIIIGAGASGAVFGVVGGLGAVLLRNRGHFGRLRGRQIGVILLFTLYYGISSSGIDNWAHLGGLASGFVLGILLYRRPKSAFGTSR